MKIFNQNDIWPGSGGLPTPTTSLFIPDTAFALSFKNKFA
jgi:hypothetical protein